VYTCLRWGGKSHYEYAKDFCDKKWSVKVWQLDDCEVILWCTVYTDLQWTTVGPLSGAVINLTRLINSSSGVACWGTPWSGHAVNWNWRTSRCSLDASWTSLQAHHPDINTIHRRRHVLCWLHQFTRAKSSLCHTLFYTLLTLALHNPHPSLPSHSWAAATRHPSTDIDWPAATDSVAAASKPAVNVITWVSYFK